MNNLPVQEQKFSELEDEEPDPNNFETYAEWEEAHDLWKEDAERRMSYSN